MRNFKKYPVFILLGALMLLAYSLNAENVIPDEKSKNKMSSEIYQLVASQDPIDFAKKHNIKLKNDAVLLMVKFAPDAGDKKGIINIYKMELRREKGVYIEAYVPIADIKALAKDEKVIFIRRPRLLIPGGIK